MAHIKLNCGTLGLSGFYRMVVSKDRECKEVTHDTGWFKNLITNGGLDRFGTHGPTNSSGTDPEDTWRGHALPQFHVGSGNSTPLVTNTALDNLIASVNTSGPTRASNYATGYSEDIYSAQFGEGVAAGNLSEIGIGNTTDLFSRALILDGGGNPTTITVLSNEFLTVYYTLRVNIPQSDQVATVSIDIDGTPTDHTVTFRPAYANATNSWANSWCIMGSWNAYILREFVKAHTSGLAAETSGPSGGSNPFPGDAGGTRVSLGYSAGTYERYCRCTWVLGEANNTINTILYKIGPGCWQANFVPGLAKDNTKELILDLGYKWAREGELP